MVMAVLTTLNRVVTVLTAGKQGPSGPMGVKGDKGAAGVALVTTARLPIVAHRCTLPSLPLNNAVVFDLALVFWQEHGDWVMGEMDTVKVEAQSLIFLDTQTDLTGCYAVVSYLVAT